MDSVWCTNYSERAKTTHTTADKTRTLCGKTIRTERNWTFNTPSEVTRPLSAFLLVTCEVCARKAAR